MNAKRIDKIATGVLYGVAAFVVIILVALLGAQNFVAFFNVAGPGF